MGSGASIILPFGIINPKRGMSMLHMIIPDATWGQVVRHLAEEPNQSGQVGSENSTGI
jgi:hypothetical protein